MDREVVTICGVTGVSYDHNTATKVIEGEMAHVIKEICADSGSFILKMNQRSTPRFDPVRSNVLRQRATMNLTRLAHLGSVD